MTRQKTGLLRQVIYVRRRTPESIANPAPSHWISRNDVSKILDVSYLTVVNLEKRGLLHSQVSADGFIKYDPVEVDALHKEWVPKGRTLKIAGIPVRQGVNEANVVSEIEKGKTPAEIVVALKVPFDFVHDVWRKMREDFSEGYETDEDRARRTYAKIAIEKEQLKTQREEARRQRAMVQGRKKEENE